MKTTLIRHALNKLLKAEWYYLLTVPERLKIVHYFIFEGGRNAN